MRVFVLCTGRSGSLTFIRACSHIDNYTSGHETRSRILGDDRFSYPDRHIEADNRLAWFPGALNERYGDDAFYVHLIRDRDQTVQSYNRRWIRYGSLIRAYCEGIHQITLHKLDRERRLAVVEDFYIQVNRNIRTFLQDKTKKITIRIEEAGNDFPRFWELIGAEGNLEAAMAAFREQHNRSKTRRFKQVRHELRFGLMRLKRRLF